MEISDIPFIKKVGVHKNSTGQCELTFEPSLLNHLQTLHASALFTLAETASADALQHHFPALVGKVAPVLRNSQIKFRKPANHSVTAYTKTTDENVARFTTQFERKGRAAIDIEVEIKDGNGDVLCAGIFNWFIQRQEN